MTTPFLAQPNPDFAELEQVLRGEQQPRRVHLVEHGIDVEVLQAINERYGEQPWIPLTERTRDAYYKQIATLHYRLGYECVVEFPRWVNHPTVKKRSTADTAELSRGERAWVNESHGLISSWEDFERFPWDTIRPDYSFCEILGRNLLPGMKVIVGGEIFEHVLEYLLGYEGLFYLLYDNPELVAQVFARWGARVYQY